MYDVIIVGGGPCGLIAGREIAKAGYEACIVEEHQEIGYPVQCSGLYSVSGLKGLGLELDKDIICNTIKGGRFYSPGGREILAYSDLERARVVEKKMFDKYLAREAARAGATIILKTKAMGLERGDGISVKVEGIAGAETLRSNLLIGADGVRSNVARWCGLKTPKKIAAAAQVEIDGVEVEDDVAEVYFGREYAPNFYAWILPKGELCEVGLGSRLGAMPPRKYLEKFIDHHPIASKKIKGKSILEVNLGGFPLEVVEKSVSNNVMLVGDAAGQTKASTGGGVITGGLIAVMAAEAAVKALEEKDFSEEFLMKEYEERWRDELGLELKVHEALRNMLDSLSDDKLDALFDLAIETGISDLMVKYQDTDRPSEFVKEMLQDERMVGALQKFLDFPVS